MTRTLLTAAFAAVSHATATPWFSGDAQPDAPIRALAFDPAGNHLYAGGDFTSLGSLDAAYLARFDLTTETWEPVPGTDTLDAPVHALLFDSSATLWAGGAFTSVSSTSPAQRVAGFDTVTSSWIALTDVNFPANSQNGPPAGTVRALFRTQDTLVIGGGGFSPGFPRTNAIILYNFVSSRYLTLSQGLAGGDVHALTFAGFGIAGGSFTTNGNGSTTLDRFGAWSPATGWINPSGFLDDTVFALSATGNTVTAAGAFTGRVLRSTAGSPWAPVAAGFPDNGTVFALATTTGDRTYAAGSTDPPLLWHDVGEPSWQPATAPPSPDTYRALATVGETVFLGGGGFSRFLPGGDFTGYVPGAALLEASLTITPDRTIGFAVRPGSIYTLETSPDLTTWTPGSTITPVTPTASFSLPSGLRTFARVRISSP